MPSKPASFLDSPVVTIGKVGLIEAPRYWIEMDTTFEIKEQRYPPLKRRSQISLLAMFLIVAAFVAGFKTREITADPAAIRSGDTLNIGFATNNRSAYRSMKVAKNESITLPVLGTISTVGKTTAELEKELIDKYSQRFPILQTIDVYLQRDSSDTR